MAEFWKSTARYYCDDCKVYVRDTPLDRRNHEATGRHKGNRERALRNIHTKYEREEREKQRAAREIERIQGIVHGASAAATTTDAATSAVPRTTSFRASLPKQPQQQKGHGTASGLTGANATLLGVNEKTREAEEKRQRKEQLEQLVRMGVQIPEELRGELAMAGEWTVTKVLSATDGGVDAANAGGSRGGKAATTEEKKPNVDAIAVGVSAGYRGRMWRDEEAEKKRRREMDEAIEGLFGNNEKRRKKGWNGGEWGRDPLAEKERAEQIQKMLLNGVDKGVKQEEDEKVKVEKVEQDDELSSRVKQEEMSDDASVGAAGAAGAAGCGPDAAQGTEIKTNNEPPRVEDSQPQPPSAPPVVVFRKTNRQNKNLRHK